MLAETKVDNVCESELKLIFEVPQNQRRSILFGLLRSGFFVGGFGGLGYLFLGFLLGRACFGF